MDEVAITSETKGFLREGTKGTILLVIYENKPVEAIFEGSLLGRDIDICAFKLKRLYTMWKMNLAKEGFGKKVTEVKRKRGRPRKIKEN